MNYSAVCTPELGSDLEQLVDLFNQIFPVKHTPESLLAKYSAPPDSMSWHGLMKDDSRLVGAMTVIPVEYRYFGEPCTFGCFVDLMIDPDARGDMLSFKKIYDAVMELIGDRMDLAYAVPNDNAYLYFRKFLKWDEICDLYYYVMPVKVGALKSKLKILDLASRPGSLLYSMLPSLSSSSPVEKGISKINSDDFRTFRFADEYDVGEAAGALFWYRLWEEDNGAQVCYIVDIDPLSPRTLDAAAAFLRRKVSCDAIMYVDSARLGPHKMIRVPRKSEPRNLHLIVKPVTDRVDDRVLDAANWQFNLADFDVR
ncbi:MAG: hypothetical protein ACR2NP_12290 [Pirellulaceae bacterium]